MKHLSTAKINQIKYALFILCLIPCGKLVVAYLTNSFGPDPVADINHTTGTWALNLLVASLAISPLKKLTHWNWLMRLRRTIAMFGFFYASVHLSSYLVFDQFFDWVEIGNDVARRPYMMAGMASYILMIPLAITSTTPMMKRLGGKHWQLLHKLAYPAAAVAVLHYVWSVKQDATIPLIYAIILLLLFLARLTKPKCPSLEVDKIKALKGMRSA